MTELAPSPTSGPGPDGSSAGGTGTDAEVRLGTLAGIAAYALWGTFPLIFHQLGGVAPIEVLCHRIIWSFVFVAGLLAVRRDRSWLAVLRRPTPDRRRLAVAAVLISINWLLYVWAVSQERVVDAALGYYVNPLITVALGMVLLHEHLRRLQLVALGFALIAVVVLTVAYGEVPWVALTLACSFAGYSYLKKAVRVPAVTSLAVETAVLLPAALVGLLALELRGAAAFGHGSAHQDLLLLSLGVVTATPLLLFAASARRIPLSLLGLLQYLTPTAQLWLSVAVLGEELPPERLAGFVLVWIALALLTVDLVGHTRSRRR